MGVEPAGHVLVEPVLLEVNRHGVTRPLEPAQRLVGRAPALQDEWRVLRRHRAVVASMAHPRRDAYPGKLVFQDPQKLEQAIDADGRSGLVRWRTVDCARRTGCPGSSLTWRRPGGPPLSRAGAARHASVRSAETSAGAAARSGLPRSTRWFEQPSPSSFGAPSGASSI